MKQTMLLKLAPSPEQHAALRETMHAFNAACNSIAEVAHAQQLANKFALQKLVYVSARRDFGLSSQLAIRAISKVVDAYKRDKRIQPRFKPEGAITYDERLMAFKGLTIVSLLTLQGRVLVPFRIGGYQQSRLESIKGQADLLFRNGVFFLAVTLDVPDPPLDSPEGTLGVDLGIVNLATDSTGESFSGAQVEQNRKRHHALRQRLQQRGTKSAKRHLTHLSGQQARFQRNTNHVISTRLVAKAKATQQAIALEELRHIRQRTEARLRHSQRATQSNWSFAQLRSFLTYKAIQAGVRLHLVNPAYTSRTCSVCGQCEKANRKSQAEFVCTSCGFACNADRNAAINISRAVVKQPLASGRAQVQAPRLEATGYLTKNPSTECLRLCSGFAKTSESTPVFACSCAGVRFIFLHTPPLKPQGEKEGVGERGCARNTQSQDDDLGAPRWQEVSVRWQREQVERTAEPPMPSTR